MASSASYRNFELHEVPVRPIAYSYILETSHAHEVYLYVLTCQIHQLLELFSLPPSFTIAFPRQATVRRPCGSTSRARAKASEVARSEFAAEMAKMMLLGFSTYFFTKSLSVCRFSVKAVVKEGCKHGDNMSTKKRTCCVPVEIEKGRQ